MAGTQKPGDAGRAGPADKDRTPVPDDELGRRRSGLEATLAEHNRLQQVRDARENAKASTGYGQAMKLSSEFVAAVAVGLALGWGLDRLAGTAPWGLVVFLLLGFAAGVVNVMRSAGAMAQPAVREKAPDDGAGRK